MKFELADYYTILRDGCTSLRAISDITEEWCR